MNKRFPRGRCLLSSLMLLLGVIALPVRSATGDLWIGSWYASPTPALQEPVVFPQIAKLPPECGKIPQPVITPRYEFENVTLRSVVHLTAGGDRLRVRLSNLYGKTELKVGAVQVVGVAGVRSATFSGHSQVAIPAGAIVASDPIDLRTFAAEKLSVSVFYPEAIPQEITLHINAAESNALIPGKSLNTAIETTEARALPHTYFLMGVDVQGTQAKGTIVAIGDSITAGGSSSWPALLAQRLLKAGRGYGVVNAGIRGNRILQDSSGPWGQIFGESAIKRFDRDVLDQPGIEYAILYEGINDLGFGGSPFDRINDMPTVDGITSAIRRLSERAHARGIRFYVATLTPYEGTVATGYHTVQKDIVRQDINKWIRTTGDIDGYIDFDRAVADPAQPNRMSGSLVLCDYLHPNAAGQRAMSEAVDLHLFK